MGGKDETARAEVRPPPEHENRELHWLATEGGSFDVAEWTGSAWLMIGERAEFSPRYLAALRHTYAGPATPPGATNDART